MTKTIVIALSTLFSASSLLAQFCAPAYPPPPPLSPLLGGCSGPSGGGGSGGPGGPGGGAAAPHGQGGGTSGGSSVSGTSPAPSKPPLCNSCAGSPCYAATGNYTSFATDMQIATPGFPLTVSRSYETVRGVDGLAGFGWSMNLTAHLYYAAYLYAAPSTYQKEADVVLPSGARYRFVENADGTFTPPSYRYDTLTKNADGSFDLGIADGSTKYHFISTGALESIADEFGNALQFIYDTNGRLQRVADAAGSGRYLDIYFGADGRISNIQDNTGRQLQYLYNANGALTSVRDPLNRVVTYTYTTVRTVPLLTRIADNWGRAITDVTYDSQGRTRTYTENGETYTYTYNYNNRSDQSSKVDSAGNRWVYTYGPDGPIVQRDLPAAATQHIVYNSDNSIQMITDEVGVKTYYTYASQGRIASVTRDYQGPLAIRFDYTYDPAFLTKITSILPRNPATNAYDQNWSGWRYDYYQAGAAAPGALWHVYRVHDDGATTDTVATYTYDIHGRVTSVADAVGSATDYVYDAAGNLASVTAPSNNDAGTRPVTSYGDDALGRLTSMTDPGGHVTAYAYDAVDRISSVTLPPPAAGSGLNFTTSCVYDNYDSASGFSSTRVTDPNGTATSQAFDQFGRLRKSIDGFGNATAYAYTRDFLATITDANSNVTSYEYDALKRLTATVFPDGARETYTYYTDGMLNRKTDRKAQAITYTYDRLKRLSQKTYPNSTYVQYTYNGQKLTQVYDNSVSPAETHTFAYDTAYRLSSNGQGSRGAISYTYTARDAVSTSAVEGGPTTQYSYYPDGSLSTITWSPVSGVFKYTYTATGQYDAINSPNGLVRSYSYDDQGRLLQVANIHPTVGNVAAFGYTYDLNYLTSTYTTLGQRVSMTANVPALGLTGAQTKYGYDTNYQLIRAEYPGGGVFNGEVDTWVYDAIGNRLTSTVNGTATNYTYQKIGTNPSNWQRMTSDGTNVYTYDANGSTATKSGYTFGWDYDNRMISIVGAATASYKYDYEGRRSARTGSATVSYLYDGPNPVAESTATATYYLFGPGIDEPLAISRGTSMLFYIVDGNGSVTLVNDAMGIAQNTYSYDAWGMSRSFSESFPQPFRYTAREQGDLQDQLFYRARFYTPMTGRFVSEDPLRYDESPNFYAYVFNNPIAYGDPSGLQCGPGAMGNTGLFNQRWAADFTKPCQAHDRCYSTCGMAKATCDSNFLRDMTSICNTRNKSFFFMKYNCLSRARTYYDMVVKWGDKSYKSGQATCVACNR